MLKPCPMCWRPARAATPGDACCVNKECGLFSVWLPNNEWNTRTPSPIERAARGLMSFFRRTQSGYWQTQVPFQADDAFTALARAIEEDGR